MHRSRYNTGNTACITVWSKLHYASPQTSSSAVVCPSVRLPHYLGGCTVCSHSAAIGKGEGIILCHAIHCTLFVICFTPSRSSAQCIRCLGFDRVFKKSSYKNFFTFSTCLTFTKNFSSMCHICAMSVTMWLCWWRRKRRREDTDSSSNNGKWERVVVQWPGGGRGVSGAGQSTTVSGTELCHRHDEYHRQ